MIAACPKCQTRYRLRPEQFGGRGVRLRCRRCEALFRVLPPSGAEESAPPAKTAVAGDEPVAPPPAPDPAVERPPSSAAPAVLVALRDARESKQLADTLSVEEQVVIAADDGAQALLMIHRAPPRVAILDAGLPVLGGHALCEVMKRNESLREIPVVLLHDANVADRDPGAEGFGADLYLDTAAVDGALEAELREPLAAWGVRFPPPAPELPKSPAPDAPTPQSAARPDSAAPAETPELAEELARAERLARIAVSDIILYNEEKFAAAIRSSDPLATMRDEVEEGRALLRGRIAEAVFARRDFVGEELLRVARERS